MSTLGLTFFFQTAFESPIFFFSVVFTVVTSIVLHELGHGFAALQQGDDTPKALGHITLDPLVHMGTFSMVMLLLVGIAWGQTPVTPSRFRSRHGDALVSFAGPAVNLLLALLSLTALGLWVRFAGPPSGEAAVNFRNFLRVFGGMNIVLFIFNLLPIPPLDGSTVLASYLPAYARIKRDPHNSGVFMALFIVVFFLAGDLFVAGFHAADTWWMFLAAR